MPTMATDSELGRHLLTLRGFHFIMGAQGDPFALFLRAESDDPHDLGRQIRDRGSLYQSEIGAWVTASHAMAARLLRDPRLGVRHKAGGEQQHVFQDPWDDPKLCHVVPLDDASLSLPQEDYARLRGLAEPYLGADAVERHRPDVARVFRERAGDLGGEFDLVADYARAAAVAVVAELTGLPAAERDRFARLCAGLDVALDAGLCPPQLKTARRLLESVGQVRDLFAGVIADRAEGGEGGDDLVGGLLAAGGGAKSADDVLAICVLVTVAGIEMTTNLVCNAAAALLDHPDQWELLRRDRGLAAAAVAETLRHDPPVRLEHLIAQEDIEIDGQEIAADSQVVVLLEAANRDPGVYTNPDRFDITRRTEDDPPLWEGLYAGLVGPLARLQATVALETLAERLPRLRRTGTVLRRMRSPVVRGVLRFPAAGE
ncbi:P450-derived glycosyltransferase activator [Spirillospora sp. NPDC047279]|uniref:cytochrome P450 family protein n=1 Tax=Spirillospora sp. NPDC047279 TaxID=3155478 RepID=UPI003408FF3C